MLQTINLANRSFHLPVSVDDSRRRKAYFDTNTGSLLPEEQEILTGLGIDAKLEAILKPYLAAFFDGLQSCQSDTNLMLNKQCEVVHYVLWQTLLAARYDTNERIKVNKATKQPLTDIDSAMTTEILTALQPKPRPADDIRAVFTLLFTDDPRPVPIDYSIRGVFTLLLTQ